MYTLIAVAIGIFIFVLTVFIAREAYRDALKSWSALDEKRAKEKARDQAGGVLIGGAVAAVFAGAIWPATLFLGGIAGIGYVFWNLWFVKWAEKKQ